MSVSYRETAAKFRWRRERPWSSSADRSTHGSSESAVVAWGVGLSGKGDDQQLNSARYSVASSGGSSSSRRPATAGARYGGPSPAWNAGSGSARQADRRSYQKTISFGAGLGSSQPQLASSRSMKGASAIQQGTAESPGAGQSPGLELDVGRAEQQKPAGRKASPFAAEKYQQGSFNGNKPPALQLNRLNSRNGQSAPSTRRLMSSARSVTIASTPPNSNRR